MNRLDNVRYVLNKRWYHERGDGVVFDVGRRLRILLYRTDGLLLWEFSALYNRGRLTIKSCIWRGGLVLEIGR